MRAPIFFAITLLSVLILPTLSATSYTYTTTTTTTSATPAPSTPPIQAAAKLAGFFEGATTVVSIKPTTVGEYSQVYLLMEEGPVDGSYPSSATVVPPNGYAISLLAVLGIKADGKQQLVTVGGPAEAMAFVEILPPPSPLDGLTHFLDPALYPANLRNVVDRINSAHAAFVRAEKERNSWGWLRDRELSNKGINEREINNLPDQVVILGPKLEFLEAQYQLAVAKADLYLKKEVDAKKLLNWVQLILASSL